MLTKRGHSAGAAGFVLCLALVAVFVAAAGCSSSSNNFINNPPLTVTGSGVMDQEDRVVNGFTGVVKSTEGDLYISPGAEALRVEAEDNLLTYLETFVDNGILRMRTQANVDLVPTLPIEFDLTAGNLDSIVHSGVGLVEATDLTANQFVMTHSGVGTTRLENFTATRITTLLSGVGDIEADGTVTDQIVTVSGVGDYEAENLASVDTTVLASGIGSATVKFSGTLNVTITSSGSVYYYGDAANVTSLITGTGTLQRLGP